MIKELITGIAALSGIVSFFYVLGIAGSLEQDLISFEDSIPKFVIGILILAVSTFTAIFLSNQNDVTNKTPKRHF